MDLEAVIASVPLVLPQFGMGLNRSRGRGLRSDVVGKEEIVVATA
jgi:hypothetical protein